MRNIGQHITTWERI